MEENTDSRFNTFIALAISILTIFSALLGWQMGNVSGEASGEYSAAQRAELNSQKVISINALAVDENHRSFLSYKHNYDEYLLVAEQLREARSAQAADPALAAVLEAKKDGLRALYLSNLKLFPNVYITREGTYDTHTQLGQLHARASRELDLDPAPHLVKAAALDAQVQRMQIALILLAVSLFFFAIVSTVESLKRNIVIIFTILGFVFALSGVIAGILNWS